MAVYLGNTSISNCYLGSSAITGCYLGSSYIFPQASNVTIKYTAPAQVVPNVAYSDSAWTLTLSSDTYDSTTSAGTVTFSGTGLTIPDGAFSATTIESVTIGKGAVSLGNETFANCANLASYKFPKTLTSIGVGTFAYGCTALTEGIILDQVTSLSSSTFYNASGLISASLPSGMTSLPEWTFNGCSSLTGFTIPEGVTEIKDRAFQGTSSLSAITIPSGVTDIATSAFNNSGLQEITFEGVTPPTVHSNSLNVANTSGVVYCPSSALSTYQSWIAGLTGQNISGWTVMGQGLPSVPFLVNYNAKRFSNGSIPQEDGAYVTLPLTINNVTFHSDYLSFDGTAQTVFNFGSDANNPFNITPSDLGLTIIAKTGRGATTSGNLISNRGLNGTTKLNWMYRPAKSDNTFTFHTMDGGWNGNGFALTTYPNIYAFRINPNDSNNGQYNSYTDNISAATGQVTCQSTQSDKIVFFNGYPDSKTEHFTGDFYWIYVAREYLTDAEVQQVISYNENL